MPTNLAALVAGLVFGLGLVVSQMTNPAKVLNFLDVFGAWDPSLMFVMAGAIPVAAIGFALARHRHRTVLGEAIHLPKRSAIDTRLIGGAALFGIGWGLLGFCPGPAIAALGFGRPEAIFVVVAVIAGMAIFELAEAVRKRRTSPA
jgi:uncharacterized protein